MDIALEISGGFAGITLRGRLTDSEISVDLAARVSKAVQDGEFKTCENTPADPLFADARGYRLTIKDWADPGEPQHYAFQESQAGDEMLDLLDELTSLLRKQLLAKRK